MLKIENLVSHYKTIEALHGISLSVGSDEIVALIGSNGAGKTTLLNSISGHVTKSGLIEFNGTDISNMPAHRIARCGLLQVPEGRHVFPGLTVENQKEKLDMVFSLFPRLEERRTQLAWSLSGGEQQMLAISRALMGNPKLLMLDEPSMGLAPKVIEELFGKIVEINRLGTPVLLVEQNAKLALSVSARAYILERGNITLEGPSEELISDERVREAYLGKRKSKNQ